MKRALNTALVLLFPVCTVLPAYGADTYPSRPIRLVSPLAPGGANDTVARVVAADVSAILRQQVIVDNRPGAGGNIGTDIVAKAPPDGYTLCSCGIGSVVINPNMAKVPYNPLTDFEPITVLAFAPHMLVVHPSLPVSSVKSLVALAKSKPGQLHFSSGGTGGLSHLAGELMKAMTGTNLVHVPYRGGAPAVTDLLAGHVELTFAGITVVLPHVQSARLRALGVTSPKRTSLLPEVPTVAESIPGFELSPWYSVLAPARTPAPIIHTLERAFVAAARKSAVREKFATQGADAAGITAAEFKTFLASEMRRWGKLIADANLGKH